MGSAYDPETMIDMGDVWAQVENHASYHCRSSSDTGDTMQNADCIFTRSGTQEDLEDADSKTIDDPYDPRGIYQASCKPHEDFWLNPATEKYECIVVPPQEHIVHVALPSVFTALGFLLILVLALRAGVQVFWR